MDANTALFFQIFNLAGQNEILDQLMIFGAKYLVFFTAFLMLFLFFYSQGKEKKAPVLAVLSTLLAIIIIQIIHLVTYEPRPFVTYPLDTLITHPSTASFPSTHSSIMAALAFPYFFYKSKYLPLFLFFMLWVGFARIFAGVHYPLDILGGFATGFISTGIIWQIKNWKRRIN